MSLSLSPLSLSELSNEELALSSQWSTLSARFPEGLDEFNTYLKSTTYVVGSKFTAADVTVFDNTWKHLQSVSDVASLRHVLRWADLVQNLTGQEKIKIDLDAAVPREIKVKEKKDAKPDAKSEPKKEAEAKKAEVPVAAKGGDAKGKDISPEEMEARKAKAEAKKAAKAKAKAEADAKAAAAALPPSPAQIDFRVGFIEKAVKHPDADSLYVSTIQMGDAEPRTVCSGLVKYIPLEDMQQRYIVVIGNLKPVNMRGIKSTAMVLCASDETKVEFVNPPAGSKPGDKLFFEGFDGTPEPVLNPKKKVWETVQPHFSTTEGFEVTYTEDGKPPARLVNAKGELCRNSSIVNAQVR
ncbi:unnamed protein product [Kuraishia capsulata CBS 1993]|uniref:tRNA-binding domain-containing protein n=1 Tax=Kuraishia capsulata CBS 1993 TaxID=1382522 RepID=W6MR11_9ASCO|nr:uncharacterized protein KUCA_T00000270001 [Kuraishia capsulata CBS 1993]CDK24310.1 unnamed protein product [Kuraishia capsulata CBS 1993]